MPTSSLGAPGLPGPGASSAAYSLWWKPGRLSTVCLGIALLFPLWLFNPLRLPNIAPDNKDLYAAASLSARHGNPYDIVQQSAETDRLFNRPGGLRPGDSGYYIPTTWGYPPIFTAAGRLLLPLGPTGFYLVSVVVLLAGAMGGLEATMAALSWQGRWGPRIFALASAPLALDLFEGNPSGLLALCFGLALLAMARGRPLVAGLLLSVTLAKLPVGLPLAAALLVAAPVPGPALRSRVVATSAMAGAALGWLALGVAIDGSGSLVEWFHALFKYGSALSPSSPRTAFAQFDMAGAPSLLSGMMSVPAALVAVTVLTVLASLFVLWRRRPADPFMAVALLVAAALVCEPYLHLNDLVLQAAPVLVLASYRSALGAFTLVTWSIGPAVNIILALVLLLVFHVGRPQSSAGFGLVMTLLVFIALLVSAWRGGSAARPAPVATLLGVPG